MRTWCLGNEMDGPWQMGTMPARDYGRKARDTARQMRVLDRSYELIACGSSNTILPTYLVWDREVLEECYDQVDAISLHNYYGNTPALTGNSTARYLAMNLDMERQILEIGAVCDYVQGIRKSPKRLWLSFDEWNVWYRARGGDFADGKRTAAPKLLEEVYNLEDALLVGGFLNTLLRQSDRVRIGCLAQIVNVIAPLVTNERGVLRQSIFHPYAWALQYARGRVVDLQVESDVYPISGDGLRADFARNDQVPFIDVAVTVDAANGRACALMLNRDLDAERELILEWQAPTPTRVLACETLTGPDLKAFEHVRGAGRGRAAPARCAGRRSADGVQAAAALLHRGPPRHRLSPCGAVARPTLGRLRTIAAVARWRSAAPGPGRRARVLRRGVPPAAPRSSRPSTDSRSRIRSRLLRITTYGTMRWRAGDRSRWCRNR